MHFVNRQLAPKILEAAAAFPCVVLTGPRRVGKTTLLGRLFPKAQYWLFEDPEIIDRFRSDPAGFMDQVKLPVIFDEVQNVPEIFGYVRARIDKHPKRYGQYFLTGSQQAPLMAGVSESMAGRAAALSLLPLSIEETSKVGLLFGGYPEIVAKPKMSSLRMSSYIQTYLERDVRALSHVKDLATFRRFIGLVASRHGQILNKSDLSAALGMSVQAVTDWLNILEVTWQILIVPPYFENFGKRLTKSPKVYVLDSGLACYLLGIESSSDLKKSPFAGALFEGFVAAEIVKHQINQGQRPALYFFRDQQGLEVDFVVPRKNAGILAIEVKASKSVRSQAAKPLMQLLDATLGDRSPRGTMSGVIVHDKPRDGLATVAPGIVALSPSELLAKLDRDE